jgi:beta-lactam-binding protein with PASTA domain
MAISYVLVYEYSSTVPEGEVISQDPPADPDNPVDPNDNIVITLTISLGVGAGYAAKSTATFSSQNIVIAFGAP